VPLGFALHKGPVTSWLPPITIAMCPPCIKIEAPSFCTQSFTTNRSRVLATSQRLYGTRGGEMLRRTFIDDADDTSLRGSEVGDATLSSACQRLPGAMPVPGRRLRVARGSAG